MGLELLLPVGIIVCWGVCAAFFAAYAGSVVGEMTYVTLADGRRTARALPLVLRLLLPLAPNLSRMASGRSFRKSREAADRMIVSAGLEGLLTGAEFVALKFLMPAVCGTAWALLVLLLGAAFPGSFVSGNAVPLVAVGALLAYVYPISWLRGTLRRRHLSIQRSLPFVLDLLTLSVEAGLDFMSALQRNCERRRPDALNEELMRMMREIQVGAPRRVALANMAERVRQPDLRGVCNALVQADELGVSIGPILRIQSDQLRGVRFDRAEKLANEAPVKMLGPLMLCIFPAVFVILLGPILMQAAKGLF